MPMPIGSLELTSGLTGRPSCWAATNIFVISGVHEMPYETSISPFELRTVLLSGVVLFIKILIALTFHVHSKVFSQVSCRKFRMEIHDFVQASSCIPPSEVFVPYQSRPFIVVIPWAKYPSHEVDRSASTDIFPAREVDELSIELVLRSCLVAPIRKRVWLGSNSKSVFGGEVIIGSIRRSSLKQQNSRSRHRL